jgi:hypothetical protein
MESSGTCLRRYFLLYFIVEESIKNLKSGFEIFSRVPMYELYEYLVSSDAVKISHSHVSPSLAC